MYIEIPDIVRANSDNVIIRFEDGRQIKITENKITCFDREGDLFPYDFDIDIPFHVKEIVNTPLMEKEYGD